MAISQSLESTPGQTEVPSASPKRVPRIWLTIGIVLSGVFVWSYWSTLEELVRTWNSSPDYSHGFLVAPLAVWFLWRRRATFPWQKLSPSWYGLSLIVLASAARMAAARFYFP